MFWRNNYSYKDAFLDYFENKNRTNYIYSESLSYRIRSENTNDKNPILMRLPIHDHSDGKLNSVDEIGMSKSFNNKFRISESKSPNRKKELTSTDRVLRSGNHVSTHRNDFTTSSFVKEYGVSINRRSLRNSYEFGALNTNFNNSGSDDLNDKQSTTTELCNYDLSGDEDLSDVTDRHVIIGSNNANSSGVGKTQQKRGSNQWFQRNMFGLPSEESDDLNQDLSGTISGDEQYDIAAYDKLNLNNASRRGKWQSSRQHKSHTANTTSNTRLGDLLFSPLAMVSFMVEWLWQIVVTAIRLVGRTVIRVAQYIKLDRWLAGIIFPPVAFTKTVIALGAYSIDRIIGTSFRRRLYSHDRLKKSLFINLIYKTCWLLFLLSVIIVGLHFFAVSRGGSVSQSYSSVRETLSEYTYRMVGRECMTKEDCCQGFLAYVQRFVYCLFCLPTSMLESDNDKSSPIINTQQPPKISTSNLSNLEDILDHIKSRLEDHDQKFSVYNSKLDNFEEDSKLKYDPNQLPITSILELTKNIENIRGNLAEFQDQFEQFKQENILLQKSVDHLTENQIESINFTSKDLGDFNEKQEKYAQVMNNLIKKTEQSSEINSDSISKLENWLHQLRIDIDHFKIRLNEINNRTIYLEESNEKLIIESEQFKKEIVDEIRNYKAAQNQVNLKLNEEMSKFENTLNENQSKMPNKNDLNELIIEHFKSLKSNLKDEMNITLWDNLTDHIQAVLETKVNYQPLQSNTSNNGQICTCLPSSCRCLRTGATCVRANHVRKLLKDAFALFSADKIGLADFALESAGGTIATTRCTETYTDRASTLTVFGIPLLRLTNSPRTIIQPSFNPGECWPMRGTRGSVVIQLSAKITVSAVSIDHIPKSLSPSESIDSAIQDFEIKALENESDKSGISLGNFTYLSNSTPIQTFSIQIPIDTKFVELIINSNYGNKDYTCIYRFRVHGKLVEM